MMVVSLPSTPCLLALVSALAFCYSPVIVHGRATTATGFHPAFQASGDRLSLLKSRLFLSTTTASSRQRVLYSERQPSQQQQDKRRTESRVWKDTGNNNNKDASSSSSSAAYTEDDGKPRNKFAKKPGQRSVMSSGTARWETLSPKAQETLRKVSQDRAVANKRKREPAEEKKQRMMMFYKKAQLERKKASRVSRPLKFSERASLASLPLGANVSGVVINLTPYGAYVDVGSECDGLLHISQMSREFFVQHPRQVLSPGQNVTVRITSINPLTKKLHLSMLPKSLTDDDSDTTADLVDDDDDENSVENNDNAAIRLEEMDIDDELWGEIVRVTDYGAYINVGAEVEGFLHFMDHPWFAKFQHPREYMSVGQRVRVWIANLERETPGRRRIKLTAQRPPHLPGPRRQM